MRTDSATWRRAALLPLTACLLSAPPIRAEGIEVIDRTRSDGNEAGRIGILYSNLHRARAQGLARKLSGLYDEYNDFKSNMEEDYGLAWSLNLSYRQRWLRPDEIGTSAQILFWPSLNWEIFDSPSLGAGSFQFLHFGERRTRSEFHIHYKGQTYNGSLPDARNRFAQLTYTHTLPGKKLAVSLGQYSFFNFDSSDYLADQQQNFVNSLFSENASATYPVAGVGTYFQYNASATVQFVGGLQTARDEDNPRFSTTGLGSGQYAHLAHVQWTPKFGELGPAQYSLTFYDSPAIGEQARSVGWSFNAVQNLNDTWAIFGRANASHEKDSKPRHTFAAGFAINNPLGRNPGDQIGIAYGGGTQKRAISRLLGLPDEKVLEAYWNWNLASGLMLTPDVQYIRHPGFMPGHDNALIVSLRALVTF